MSKRAVILAGKMIQDHEFIYPYYRLDEEGFGVDVVVRGKETVQGQIGIKIVPTKDVPEVKVSDYQLIVIPGGAKAMEYMRQDAEMLKLISDFHRSGKIVASICHGAQMLISANLVRGRKISGYYSIRDDINNAGATYVDAPFVKDDRIVTCPHYKYLGPWMKAVLEEVRSHF